MLVLRYDTILVFCGGSGDAAVACLGGEVRPALRPTKGQRAPLPPDEPIRTIRMVIWFRRSKEMEVSG